MTELTTAQLFDQLNRFRERNGKAPLKSWKESKQKLLDALNKETASLEKQQPRQEVQQTKEHVITAPPAEHKVPSKERTAELKAARLENERKNVTLEKMEQEQPSPSAKSILVKKTIEKNKAKIERNSAKKQSRTKTSFSAAQIILDFGIDPKQGRALLRKHKVARTPEAIRAFFTARKK